MTAKRVGSRVLLAAALLSCSTRATGRVVPTRSDPGEAVVRVALALQEARIAGTRGVTWIAADGRTALAAGRGDWRLEAAGDRVRAIRSDGAATSLQRTLLAQPADGGFITANGKRFRGDLRISMHEGNLLIVNRVPLEDYLKGVVPLEMGPRPRSESAALEAQAVASRSYAYARVGVGDAPFDLRATVANQAYGGVEAENDAASAAVDATRGLVLRYDGRLVDAPYHSTCGGSTAEPQEVWRASAAPHLKRVSDRIPGTDRDYCAIAPRHEWTRSFSAPEVNQALARYLATYAAVPAGGPGVARTLVVRSRTESDRVGLLAFETNRGAFTVRGDEARYVLRTPRAEILPSTYFIVEPRRHSDGTLSELTVRGKGNGHGIGMCQWGAIARAREGHSFRSILGTYYPGTTVGPVP